MVNGIRRIDQDFMTHITIVQDTYVGQKKRVSALSNLGGLFIEISPLFIPKIKVMVVEFVQQLINTVPVVRRTGRYV
jgi:hypothetical protein